MQNQEQPNNKVRTNQKSCYEYILSCKIPPVESPIKGKTIRQFHNENLRFAKKLASKELAKRIYDKYQELGEYLVSDENRFKKEAIILKNIASGKDSISNYQGEELLRIYLYFKQIYHYQASFYGAEDDILSGILRVININEDFKGIYLLEFKSEKIRCLNDALNGEYELTPDDIVSLDFDYETQNGELKSLIKKVFKNKCNIGAPIGLTKDELAKEFKDLYYFIIDRDEKEGSERPFDIVDMYLTTNIQIDDFNSIYNLNLPHYIIVRLSKWYKDLYAEMFEPTIRNPLFDSSRNISLEVNKPSIHIVRNFTLDNFGLYYPISHNIYQVKRAYFVLCDLNQKYGVKYDHFTFMAILRSVVKGEESSYYTLGDEHKQRLDEVSHIVVHEQPVLTRREKNDAN